MYPQVARSVDGIFASSIGKKIFKNLKEAVRPRKNEVQILQ